MSIKFIFHTSCLIIISCKFLLNKAVSVSATDSVRFSFRHLNALHNGHTELKKLNSLHDTRIIFADSSVHGKGMICSLDCLAHGATYMHISDSAGIVRCERSKSPTNLN